MTKSLSPTIRVMIVDDHTMVRRGLATFLKAYDDLELVGEAENGQFAIKLCGRIQPDVILMDMVMPDMNGAMATRKIREKFPKIQVIALTSFKEEELVKNALEAGAIGYLLKDVSADDLVKAIRAAHVGRATRHRRIAWGLRNGCDRQRGHAERDERQRSAPHLIRPIDRSCVW